MIGIFWILPGSYSYPDTFRVLVEGVERTDYRRITGPDGSEGVQFDEMTYAEMCNVQVQKVVRPLSCLR